MMLLYLSITLLMWPWIVRLGGPGLVLLGIADNSLVPLTGSMDIFTIWLSAKHRDLWPYYAVMATAGSVLGGYITYALARQAGREAIENRLHKDRAQRLFRRFRLWGFRTVALSAILPPPFPMVPVLLAAGALQCPRNKFLGALALGRGARYFLLAALGSIYGKQIEAFFTRYYKPALLILIAAAAIGGMLALIEFLRSRRQGRKDRRLPVSYHRAA